MGSTADEGVGAGYDDAYPYAYVEHWFDTADDPAEVEAWYRHQLIRLGWNEERDDISSMAAAGVQHVSWSRSGDETISLTWFGGEVNLGWSHPSHRLAYTVEGTWLDGGDDPRPQ